MPSRIPRVDAKRRERRASDNVTGRRSTMAVPTGRLRVKGVAEGPPSREPAQPVHEPDGPGVVEPHPLADEIDLLHRRVLAGDDDGGVARHELHDDEGEDADQEEHRMALSSRLTM